MLHLSDQLIVNVQVEIVGQDARDKELRSQNKEPYMNVRDELKKETDQHRM